MAQKKRNSTNFFFFKQNKTWRHLIGKNVSVVIFNTSHIDIIVLLHQTMFQSPEQAKLLAGLL